MGWRGRAERRGRRGAVLGTHLLPLLGLLSAPACGTPRTVTVDLQFDLVVDAATDPWAALGGVRICVTELEQGTGQHADYPRDPGDYVFPGVPAGVPVEVVVQALDLNPTEIEGGGVPVVLAEARSGQVTLGDGATVVEQPFQLCGDACGQVCEDRGGATGDAVLGIRRREASAP